MYCTKCGKQIGDYDTICSGCGKENYAVKTVEKPIVPPFESPIWVDLAFVFAVVFPIFGLVWSLIVGAKYRSSHYSNRCAKAVWVALICSVVSMFIYALIFPLILEPIGTLLTPMFDTISQAISPIFTEAVNIFVGFISGISDVLEKILVPIATWLN